MTLLKKFRKEGPRKVNQLKSSYMSHLTYQKLNKKINIKSQLKNNSWFVINLIIQFSMMLKKIFLPKKVKKTHIMKSIYKKPFLNLLKILLKRSQSWTNNINKNNNKNLKTNLKSLLKAKIQIKLQAKSNNKKYNSCTYPMPLNHLHINHSKKPTNLSNGLKLIYPCSVKATKLTIIKATLIYWIKLIKKMISYNNKHQIFNVSQTFQLIK